MAHQLSIRDDKFVEMAFVGSRSEIWHGLGNELTENASIETWKTQAGMDWHVEESPITYQTVNNDTLFFPEKKILYRSDTDFPLSVVGADYHVVQPGEVLDFFKDLVSGNGMKLSSAGTLFDGKRFWALAETGKQVSVTDNDSVAGFLLLTTSVDGTLATTAKFTSCRVVCNNTLTIAMNEQGKTMSRTTHKSIFNPKEVKIDLGLIDQSWDSFIGNLKSLSEIKMTDTDVRSFYEKLLNPKKDEIESTSDRKWGITRKVDRLMELYAGGAGADMAKGTAWGALNGVTNMYTHGSGNRNASHQFWDAYYGGSDKIKSAAMETLLELA